MVPGGSLLDDYGEYLVPLPAQYLLFLPISVLNFALGNSLTIHMKLVFWLQKLTKVQVWIIKIPHPFGHSDYFMKRHVAQNHSCDIFPKVQT